MKPRILGSPIVHYDEAGPSRWRKVGEFVGGALLVLVTLLAFLLLLSAIAAGWTPAR